jgi:hypothetical protein
MADRYGTTPLKARFSPTKSGVRPASIEGCFDASGISSTGLEGYFNANAKLWYSIEGYCNMTKHTKRDKIWSAALRLREKGAFTVEHVLFAASLGESSERTARDVLNTMADMDFLNRLTTPMYNQRSWVGPSIEPELKDTDVGTYQTYPGAFDD